MKLKLISLFCGIVSSLSAFCNDEVNQEYEFVIQDVVFDYEIFTNSLGKKDCKGPLYFTIKTPKDAVYLEFRRTGPHKTEDQFSTEVTGSHFPVMNRRTLDYCYPGETVRYEIPEAYWGTIFMVYCRTSDEEKMYTPKYNINAYISDNDFDLLKTPSGVSQTNIDDTLPYYNPSDNSIHTAQRTYVELYNILGEQLFNGYCNGELSLDFIPQSIIVAKYICNGIIITQKIAIK